MGRRKTGKAISGAERQRRYMKRLHAKAARPAPAQTISTDGITIRMAHLAMDPARSAEWLVLQKNGHGSRRARRIRGQHREANGAS